MNSAILQGTLAAGAKVTTTDKGDKVAKSRLWFSVYKKDDPNAVEGILLSAWGKQAEALAEYVEGDELIVKGRIKIDKVDGGGTRTEFVVENIFEV